MEDLLIDREQSIAMSSQKVMMDMSKEKWKNGGRRV
jgi:hypothetical protein